MRERSLLDTLRDWSTLEKNAEAIQNKINKTTPAQRGPSIDHFKTKRSFHMSGVEKYVENKDASQRRLDAINGSLEAVREAIDCANLDAIETRIILDLIARRSVLATGREFGITQAQIYRHQKNAISKVQECLDNRLFY